MNRTPVVCSFESRRSEDMSALIERHGGVPVLAPSMREIPVDHNPVAVDFIQRAIRGEFDVLVLLTGVGTTALFDVAHSQGLYESLRDVLPNMTVVVRGPKPAAVLQNAGLRYNLKAPEPNTWRELLSALDQAHLLRPGVRIAVQEYGVANQRLYDELQLHGAQVTAVPVYRWELPEDTGPLESAIAQIVAGQIDIVLLTSANQITSALTVAARKCGVKPLVQAVNAHFVGSVGPTCSEALRDQGIEVDFEASPPKMGPLVRGAIAAWRTSSCPGITRSGIEEAPP